MGEHWYVLRSKPHKEIALFRYAHSKGLEVFYPRIRVDPVNPRSRKIRPYFPGYMFVNVDLDEVGLSSMQYMPLSIGLVKFGDEPAPVPEPVVERLKTHVGELWEQRIQQRKFEQGDMLLVRDGPFEGYEAIFDIYLSGRDRVRVLLEMLSGRPVGVELDPSSIEKQERSKG